MGQPAIGGETSTRHAERGCHKEPSQQAWYQTLGTDDSTETLLKGVADSFKAGGSIVFNVAASYQRAYDNPVDPDFEPRTWLDENREKYQIEIEDLSLFAGTRSASEAYNLLAYVKERTAALSRIQRMSTMAQLTVKTIAALPDITIALGGIAAFLVVVRSAFRHNGKPERASART